VGAGPGGGTGTGTVNVNLPPGVTLQQIYGGSNYYCSNGFTYACEDGWDTPSFFPILDDYSFYSSNSTSTFKQLGLNTTVRVTSGTNLATLRNAGVFAVLDDTGTGVGSETTGTHIEEPSSWSQITSQASSINSLFGTSGRFFQPSFTWSQFVYSLTNGTPCGPTMQEVMTCTSGMPNGRHLDVPTADIWWFAGSGDSNIQYGGGLIYTNKGSATADEMARGSNYGDMVDTMESWVNGNAPTAPYIETEDALINDSSAREITPPELNWAVWSTIVHGARLIIYFGTTSKYGSVSTFGFSKSVLSGQSVSMYNQAKSTNNLVHDLAPVINSPFALHYASVTPAAYTFPTQHIVWDAGIDAMTKYYNGGFYIFASPRGSETLTNVPATFTLAGNYSGPVPVTCACSPGSTTGTVSVTNHQITDTFAHAWDVHIYGPIPNQ
jgi:hypothetical protein